MCCNHYSIKKNPDKNITHEHTHDKEFSNLYQWMLTLGSLLLLISGIYLDYNLKSNFFKGKIRLLWYFIAYLLIAFPVLLQTVKHAKKGSFFNEFSLMLTASLGAFYIGEYPEGVAVMIFYTIGEFFQEAAVSKAKKNIKALLDIRPKTAEVFRNNVFLKINPEHVDIGEIIQVHVGERIPLDGLLKKGFESSFDTSALTGESRPQKLKSGQNVLAGMINLQKSVEIEVTRIFNDSSLARILDLVQNASSKKARTEQLISRLAKIYTPIVTGIAFLFCFLPYFFMKNYVFDEWIHRSLIFLVISCPCALVISIPLGYFGGIGAASRMGILFKGSNYLDIMSRLNTVVMDKTGTLTKGLFNVQKIVLGEKITEEEVGTLAAALESKSTHPVAQAICRWATEKNINTQTTSVKEIEEIPGYGIIGKVNDQKVLAGNGKLLKRYDIDYPITLDQKTDTLVMIALDGRFAGCFIIADELKEDAAQAIANMQEIGIQRIVLLSGDKNSVVQKIAESLSIREAYGDLLPEDKVKKVENIKQTSSCVLAFAGDGINDAPVLALSDVGIAMGGLGSDVAIETADVVIQTDQPSRIATAVKIGRVTKKIIWQNISLAFIVKGIVLILGAGNLANMWEAVFADVGVSLIAIMNAVRIQRMNCFR